MNKILILIVTVLSLVGCGIENGSNSDEKMEIAKLYTVNQGDQVIKDDENASVILKVHHTGDSAESVIELIQGQATIIHQ